MDSAATAQAFRKWRGSTHHYVATSYLDVHRSRARALYVASWQRSGSTWLAQIVASMPGTRLVYEPANVRQRLFKRGEPRTLTLPLIGPGARFDDGAVLSKALDGSLRSPWVNLEVPSHRSVRRVVKDVRTIPVLPWMAGTFPEVPMVLLLRHPVAVAHSIIELGWIPDPDGLAADGRHGDDPEFRHDLRQRALLDEVALWSAHHGWAMSHPASARIHVMFYEDLVKQTTVEIERLQAYLAGFHPVWSTWAPDPDAAGRPSATSFRRQEGTPSEWIDNWSGAYDPATLEQVQRIIEAEHLSSLYSLAPTPLITADSALDAVRRAAR